MLREELKCKAKSLGIKGISRMKKVDLEWAIFLKENTNDIVDKLTITDEDVDVSLNVIDLKDVSLNYKMWDIPKEKQMWLIS